MPRVLIVLQFFPRGGSAHVARSLARNLPDSGWEATIVSGSHDRSGGNADAVAFYDGLSVHTVDYGRALDAPEPLLADPPLHPSFEDRPGAPDRIFAGVDDATYEHMVRVWERELRAAGAGDADLLHLNHLTPVNEAAMRAFPDLPRIGHLHGTELLMLNAIESGPPPGWDHARAWGDRMRRWARSCDRLLVLSPDAAERAPGLLGVEPERIAWAPNGFDPAAFDRRSVDRRALWRRWLVDDPRGWGPEPDQQEPGSVVYSEADLDAFDDGPVLLYVGRYTEVKRIPLLIRAYVRARERFDKRAPLVLLGGYPGEWEGEHPLDVVRDTGVRDVFLAGWRGHDDLPDGLNAGDVVVLPSVHEQFGQVIVEGMACGLPAIAVDAHGPASIIKHGDDGWLVEPDDEDGLVDALVEAVNDDAERHRRGDRAYDIAHESYAWPALAEDVAKVYDEVVGPRLETSRLHPPHGGRSLRA